MTSLPEPLDSDEEVCRERAKVKNNESYNEILSMDDLSRVYRINLGRHKRVAVNQLCLKVNKGEVDWLTHCSLTSQVVFP